MNIFITGTGGFIGGSIAARLARDGYTVRGLIRRAEQREALERLGIEAVVGSLDDTALLAAEARAANAVINAASSDHRGAVEALIGALEGSNKPLLHTSGSSVVGNACDGDNSTDHIYTEDNLPEPTADKAARVAIDDLVLAASERGVRSSVLCNTLIYGHGAVPGTASVQLPRLERQAKKSGIVRHVGRGLNTWSNVHIDDVVDVYRRALDKSPAGTFYFVESGEANFRDMSAAMAKKLNLHGTRARTLLGWAPKRTSVIEWIETELA